MRVLFGLLIGLVVGFAGATWFYGEGGNIIVSGRELFPRSAAASAAPAVAPPATAPARPGQPGRSRVVVRDVTDEVAAAPPAKTSTTPASAPAGAPAAGAAGKPVTRHELTSWLVVLVPRL
jgi:hypothetical protein